MGMNGRRRRAAKQRQRATQRSATVHGVGDRSTESPSWAFLVGEWEALVAEAVPALWDQGWQPADVHRVVAREASARAAALLASAIVSDSHRYQELGRRVAPRWMEQVGEIADGRQLTLSADGPPDHELLIEAGAMARLLTRLPALPVLEPPPSAWHPGMATTTPAADVSESLLAKVRALLAKAESTEFEAEAETFTAKAQEMMTRHRIDRAVLETSVGGGGDGPAGRRLGVDNPYADAKVMLLAAICEANGARSVWSKGFGFATVFGFPVELDLIEELFTSLLVQSSAALRREGSKQDAFGRSRTKSFRRTFLVAFAQRIGERLQGTAAETVAASAADSDALLPALAERDAEVDAVTDDVFPEVRSFRASASDAEGWYAGRAFGDRADLGVGAPVTRRSAS